MSTITRFEDIVSNMHEYTFHMLGCGAIGSSAATQLARTGASKFCLYDMDKVEEHNIGVSQYNLDDIGRNKVDALQEHILSISPDSTVYKFNERFSEYYNQEDNDIVILGFDSMKSRMDAVVAICNTRKPLCIIDGRMGAEHYQQYVIKSPTIKKYEKVWYPDSDGDPEPCTATATSYCANMSGSIIVNSVRKLITNQPYDREFSFNFPTMMLAFIA